VLGVQAREQVTPSPVDVTALLIHEHLNALIAATVGVVDLFFLCVLNLMMVVVVAVAVVVVVVHMLVAVVGLGLLLGGFRSKTTGLVIAILVQVLGVLLAISGGVPGHVGLSILTIILKGGLELVASLALLVLVVIVLVFLSLCDLLIPISLLLLVVRNHGSIPVILGVSAVLLGGCRFGRLWSSQHVIGCRRDRRNGVVNDRGGAGGDAFFVIVRGRGGGVVSGCGGATHRGNNGPEGLLTVVQNVTAENGVGLVLAQATLRLGVVGWGGSGGTGGGLLLTSSFLQVRAVHVEGISKGGPAGGDHGGCTLVGDWTGHVF
jgi:hypothetical protein